MSVYYTVTYNGVTFDHAKLDWSEEPIYADDHMTLEGISYKFTVSGSIIENSQADFYDTLSTIRCALTVPRQTFTAVWGSDEEGNMPDGETIIAVSSADDAETTGYTPDIAWGPIPGNIKITEFIAGRAASYSWTLSTKTKECYSGLCSLITGNNPNILSLTAKWTHTVDSVGLTNRTVSGNLVLTSGTLSVNNKSADYFRNYVLPSLPTWFKPEKQEYTQSEDGRVLNFSVSQQERYWTLPYPAADGQASMNIHTENYGALAMITFNGYFVAPASPNYGKGDLINLVYDLISDRMNQYIALGLTPIPMTSDVKDDIYSGRIDFNITFRIPTGLPQTSLQGFLTDPGAIIKLGTFTVGSVPPDGSDSGISTYIGPYGGDGTTSDSGIIAAVPTPYDACVDTVPTSGGAANTNIPSGIGTNNGGGDATEANSDSAGQYSQGISDAHAAFPYFGYQEILSFELDNGWVPFYPKISSTTSNAQSVLFQQVRQPKLTIIQAGYASRVSGDSGGGPIVPPPFCAQGQNFSVVRNATISPEVPTTVGQNQAKQYTVHWRYVIDVSGPFTQFTDLNLAYPVDPRTNAAGSTSDPYNGTDVGESFEVGQTDIVSVDGTDTYIPVLEPG